MKPQEITFRPAKQSDIPFLMELRLATMEEHLSSQGIHLSMAEHKERVLHAFDGAKIILLEAKEIGLLKVTETQEVLEIHQFQILKGYQGRGLGKQILESLISKANLNNCITKLSVLKSNKAKFLYEKVGFKNVGEDENSYYLEWK